MVAVEAGVVEPSIGIADTQSESWVGGCDLFSQSNAFNVDSVRRESPKLTVRRKIIDHIQIIRSEVRTSKWRIVWHSKTSCTASSE